MNTITTEDGARDNALAHLTELRALFEQLDAAQAADDADAIERVEETLGQTPLEVLTRTAWAPVGAPVGEPAQMRVLLSCGGPAAWIECDIGEDGCEWARVHYSGWTGAGELTDAESQDTALRFCDFLLPR